SFVLSDPQPPNACVRVCVCFECGSLLDYFSKYGIGFRVLIAGGDGTVGWLLSTLDELKVAQYPPVRFPHNISFPTGSIATGRCCVCCLSVSPDCHLAAGHRQRPCAHARLGRELQPFLRAAAGFSRRRLRSRACQIRSVSAPRAPHTHTHTHSL